MLPLHLANTGARCRADRSTRGFTIIELLMVLAIVAISSAMAVMITPRALRQGRADSGALQVASALRDAREEAIAKRRNIEVSFIGNNGIRVTRIEYDFAPATPTIVRQVEKTVYLAGDIQFQRPAPTAPVPAFAPNSNVVTYADINGAPAVVFTPEGSAVGADGNPVDGTIFLGRVGEPEMARAVTMTGVTSFVDRWAYSGTSWALAK